MWHLLSETEVMSVACSSPTLPGFRNSTDFVKLQAAQIRVLLPSGYLCTVVGNGTADPEGEKSFFQTFGSEFASCRRYSRP